MVRKIALIILAVLSTVTASEVNRADIQNAAHSFMEREALFCNSSEPFSIVSTEPLSNNAGETVAYVTHLSPTGFILLSADSECNPILAYSHNSRFTGRRQTVEMIDSDIQYRMQALALNTPLRQKNYLRWQELLSGEPVLNKSAAVQTDSIYYFPTPVWGQGYVNGSATFNYYTPNHWSTGCVATAMAEVLAYYQWPPHGTKTHSYYEDDAGTLSADYENTWYDWPNMLFQYKDIFATPDQRRAAGLLSYHTAIGVNMDFESSGSTAETADAPNAFHNYFRLSGHYTSVGASGFWTAMENNMKDARPAILSIKTTSGMGHAVAVDGFSESNGYYHLNMGWDGDDNGFYDISGSWNAGGYTIVVGATKGLVPNPMIREEVVQLTETSFVLSWAVSPEQRAQYYELQQATSASGPWSTVDAAISDTFYTVNVPDVRNYYFRVRTRRNDIWWDWSEVQKITLGGPRMLTFNVNMTYQTLNAGDSLVIRGTIEPLMGSQNSPAMSDSNGDGIYSLTLPFDFDYAGQELTYRFAIAGAGGTTMESVNRTYSIGWDEFQNLDTVYFDNFVSMEDEAPATPETSILYQNYPNPFNPGTSISYRIGTNSNSSVHVVLSVYNALGQKVATLVSAKQNPGVYSVRFDASGLPSGVYFYKLEERGKIQIRKMVLLQ